MTIRQVSIHAAPWVLALSVSVLPVGAAGRQTASAPAPPQAAAATQPTQPSQPERTAAEDHRNMMEQLGIKALRPGPSGNETGAEPRELRRGARPIPYPNLPDVLTLKNGRPVKTADAWWKQRRPEIVEDFEREVLGRVPKNVPQGDVDGDETAETTVGTCPVIGQANRRARGQLVRIPAITVDIQMTW